MKVISAGFIVLLIFLAGCLPKEPPKTYTLTETIPKADFDYETIKNIDAVPPPYPADSPYQIGDLKTVKGPYTIYKFICEYYGDSKFSEKPVKLHDLLVIKTDNKNKIIDAFHYTLEWTDSPSLDLYHLKNKDVPLENGMKIKELKLTNITTGNKLEEKGEIFILNYR
ncbi:MAG: hypothetical protein KKA31_04205 [Candidatus Margulisbacteria bacterium]|nr:hypothetical protein [Candidatus Margulisiibacteriota bacterium]